MKRPVVLSLLLCGLFCSASALAAESADIVAAKPVVADSEQHHRGVFGGHRVAYDARVENYRVQPHDAGAVNLVSTSFVADVKDATQRPVLFVFNGGPIAPAVYLQMLGLGPRRLAIPDDLHADPKTFRMVDNPDSVLDAADLVFYDPAGTGFSRFAVGTDPHSYFGNVADAREFVAFVHAWLQRHGRVQSPVYVLGESYGTQRAAEAARQLANESPQLNLRGVFLLGQALNLTETAQRPENIISYVVSLPTLAALGWYHGKVDHAGRTLEQLLDEARRYAAGPYLQALYQGSTLPQAQRQEVADRLQALTGLDASVYLENDLRVSKNLYRVQLLKAQNLVLGANDGRYAAVAGSGTLPDASMAPLVALPARYADYAKRWLRQSDTSAYLLDSPVQSIAEWDWGAKTGPFGNWPYDAYLGEAMKKMPQLRVAVGVGYYDTLTTTGATEYMLAQAGWPQDRTSIHYYAGGHMVYTVQANLHQLATDLRAFIAAP